MRILFISLFLFLSCSNATKTLPNATGKLSEVIFVADDNLWKDILQKLVFKTFGRPINGTNYDESLFKIIQINFSEFKSILKTHKNIVIISDEATNSSEFNKWAVGQYVNQLSWNNSPQNTIKDLDRLCSMYKKREISSVRELLKKSSNKELESKFLTKFNNSIVIPKEYKIIKFTDSFFRASYDPNNSDEIKNILSFTFKKNDTNVHTQVLSKTDSIFKLYLAGSNEGSYVRIEPLYKPIISNNIYRGLWRLEGGFMGGAFLIKTYFLQEDKKEKVHVNVGVIFAPQSRKRKYIKEFEAIL
jgi:hypothetical protein